MTTDDDIFKELVAVIAAQDKVLTSQQRYIELIAMHVAVISKLLHRVVNKCTFPACEHPATVSIERVSTNVCDHHAAVYVHGNVCTENDVIDHPDAKEIRILDDFLNTLDASKEPTMQ
jgi:hypothetical protein